MKFTDYTIKSLKPKKIRYEVYETNSSGFGIRISERGQKSWLTRYRRNGRLVKITHGPYDPKHGITLAAARLAHNECRKLLHNGIDPARKIHAKRQEERNAGTVADLAHEYLERYAKVKKRSWREDARIIEKDVLPEWRHLAAKDITRRDLVLLLDGVKDRGAPVMANRTLALLTKMFSFAIERGILDASPCVHIKKPGGKENPNMRALDQAEIRTFWTKLGEASMSEGTRLALRLILVTGQRSGEVAGAPWSELDMENRLWRIPETRTKNEHPHVVPLTDLALDLLEQAKALAGDSTWVFPSPVADKRSITSRSLARAVARNQLDLLHWSPHALRKSARTEMGKLVDPRFAERVLNHLPPKLERTYDRHDYLPEKRQALEAWARRLQAIIDGDERDNVVSLSR